MLLATSAAIISIYIDMIVYAPILGVVAEDLGINMGAAANLIMGFVLSVAVVLILGGAVCDKYGVTTALVLGLLCASLPATFIGLMGDNYTAIFVARLIQGASVGFIFAVIGPVSALWFPPTEQGLAGGIMIGALSVGSAIGVVISPPILEAVGSWQTTVAILSIPGWVSIVLALLITRRSPSSEVLNAIGEAMKSNQKTMTFRGAIFTALTVIGSFILFFEGWGLYVLYNLVPAYLATADPVGLGLGAITAGKISLAVTVVGIFAMISGGIFFDKVAKGDARYAVVIGFILMGVFSYFILTPFVYTNLSLLVVCLVIAGWGPAFLCPSISAFIVINYPPNIVGRMVGLWFGFGTFGGALGLYLGGQTVVRLGNFYWAIMFIPLVSILGLILGFLMKPKSQNV
jgi:MFS family permease